FIKKNYPEVTLIEQDKNLGFGQANNIGLRYALEQGSEHFFLLNQDAYLLDNTVEQLVDFQERKPNYGILSPIHLAGNKNQLDNNFAKYMNKELSGRFYSDFVLRNAIAPVYDVPFVNAAAWLLSRKCLNQIGGFDPLFFHYGEDDNYCQRVLYHKFRIGVMPNSFIIHDRELKKRKKLVPYSQDYYEATEKYYKKKFANILLPNHLEHQFDKITKELLKLAIQFKFKELNNVKRKLDILNRVRPLIDKSRFTNMNQGCHYI
ncbi:MAG: glycosyltransferase, partial [Bacteroidota bacterium]